MTNDPRFESRPDQQELVRRRQKARATVMAVLLGAFVILVFLISIAKIRQGMGQ